MKKILIAFVLLLSTGAFADVVKPGSNPTCLARAISAEFNSQAKAVSERTGIALEDLALGFGRYSTIEKTKNGIKTITINNGSALVTVYRKGDPVNDSYSANIVGLFKNDGSCRY